MFRLLSMKHDTVNDNDNEACCGSLGVHRAARMPARPVQWLLPRLSQHAQPPLHVLVQLAGLLGSQLGHCVHPLRMQKAAEQSPNIFAW